MDFSEINWNHLVRINKCMKNYTAQHIESFMNQYEKHISHVLVAHTKLHTYNKSRHQIQAMTEQAKKDCRYALNSFYKLLYPNATNKPVRNPWMFKPLTLVTIEGAKETTDKAQTIHFNISLGKLPNALSTTDIETLFKHAWHEKAGQSQDVKAYAYTKAQGQQGWIGYTLKEAQQAKTKAWATDGIWDVQNCWIPFAALNAD